MGPWPQQPAEDDGGIEFDIEVIERTQEENGDYSFTFTMTPQAAP